jgi:hypothetical protein
MPQIQPVDEWGDQDWFDPISNETFIGISDIAEKLNLLIAAHNAGDGRGPPGPRGPRGFNGAAGPRGPAGFSTAPQPPSAAGGVRTRHRRTRKKRRKKRN